MSIEKRGASSWRVQTQIRTADGSLRWLRKTIRFPSTMSERQQRREAQIAEAHLLEEARGVTVAANASPTIAMLCDMYLKRQCADASPVTVNNFTGVIETYIKPVIGSVHLDDLTQQTMLDWLDDLRATGLAKSTVKQYFRLMSTILNTAVKWDLLSSNPMTRITTPKAPPRETQSLTEEQLRRLIADLATDPNVCHRCAALLAVMCGMRVGEICALRVTDIDFENSMIHITHAAKYSKATGAIIAETKTASSRRAISAPPVVMEELRASKAAIDFVSQSRDHDPDHNFIIHNTTGAAMSTQTIKTWWSTWSKKHGLPNTRFHDLRHTHASLLIANNVDIVTVSKRLGHASTATTLSIYAHALRRRDTESSDIMQSLINKSK